MLERFLIPTMLKRVRFKGKFHRDNLLIVLIIAMVPTILIAVGTYAVGTMQIEKEVNRNHLWQTQQFMSKMNENFLQLEITVSQFAIHPLFEEKLTNIDLSQNYDFTYNIYRSLLIMKGTNPLIYQVSFYSEPHQAIINEQGVQKITAPAIAEFYETRLRNERAFFWSDVPEGTYGNVFPKMLLFKIPVNDAASGMIVIMLDKNKVNSLISQPLTSAQDFTLVMENKRLIAFGGNPDSTESKALASFAAAGSAEASGIQTFNGNKFSVSYAAVNRLNETWRYVTATPLSQVTAPIQLISRWLVGMSILGLFFAITLSWIGSRRIYKPIDKLIQMFRSKENSLRATADLNEIDYIGDNWEHITREIGLIKQRLDEVLPDLKEGFLLQLVSGHMFALTETELKFKMNQLGWMTDDRRCSVLVVMLSGFPNGQTSFTTGDESLVSFAATNIISELCRKRLIQSYVLNYQDLTVGILTAFPAEMTHEQTKQQLFQLSNEIIQTLNVVLKLDITVSVGRIISEIKSVPLEMQNAREHLKYRNMRTANQILDIESLMPTNKTAYFPLQIEKEIVQAIHMWQGEEAVHLIKKFWDDLQGHGPIEVEIFHGMRILLGSIMHAILQAGFHPYNLYEGKNLFNDLNQMQDKEAIIRWFSDVVLKPYMDEVRKSQDLQKKQMVDKVVDIVHSQYMNDISLEQCAERVGTLPYTLSRAFKQITGTTFVIYVTQLKINKCKDLMQNSDLMLSEIAVRIGWHPSYLNKIFKKYEGITPGQYRDKYL